MDNHERFGVIVKGRRQQLKMTQSDVSAAGGPSFVTVSKIERNVADHPLRPSTFQRLDTALGWEPGSAERAYHGGDPKALYTERPRPDQDVREMYEQLRREKNIQAAAWRMADLDDEDIAAITGILQSLRRSRGLPADPDSDILG
ncbi:helix-turn-helix domain-containing protein [Nocardia terpenica]|uniref:HTH cro/C1-type domain-containing protein n=1 Tax=Nocardia terpenica TaxID=455432 RepID=A0A291RYZ0_9NOCA|nr:helix-turn-helix transcriptional regulator [Nocardia terpenica]ATL72537.1 hypothetical protein CRH09_39905 [Nocardia terpenica]